MKTTLIDDGEKKDGGKERRVRPRGQRGVGMEKSESIDTKADEIGDRDRQRGREIVR